MRSYVKAPKKIGLTVLYIVFLISKVLNYRICRSGIMLQSSYMNNRGL